MIPAFPSVLLALPDGHLSSFTSSSLLNSFRLGFTRWTITGIEIGLSRKAARLRIKNGLILNKNGLILNINLLPFIYLAGSLTASLSLEELLGFIFYYGEN